MQSSVEIGQELSIGVVLQRRIGLDSLGIANGLSQRRRAINPGEDHALCAGTATRTEELRSLHKVRLRLRAVCTP